MVNLKVKKQNIRMNKLKLTLSLALLTNILSAQSQSSGSNLLFYVIVAVCAVLVIWAMLGLAGNLLKIEASKYGIDNETSNFGVFPDLRDFIKPKRPSFATGGTYHSLKKGFDISLEGKAEGDATHAGVSRFAIRPGDFRGMSPIPKVEVEVGFEIKAGDVLFYDKKRPEIQYVSPVSGEVVDIRRGEKRSITEVVILADKELKYKRVSTPDLQS